MSHIEVVTSQNFSECELNELRSRVATTYEKIRERAYELFERRGGGPGRGLEDWLSAETDYLYRPPAELVETDSEARQCVGASGFHPERLRVLAEPTALTVEGSTFAR